jgi:hypothetical protein
MHDPVTLVFTGRLAPSSFTDFVHHRAARLALDLGLRAIDTDRAEMTVLGDPDLVDAFEMACSLGPIDCVVLDCTRAAPAGGTAR